MARSVWKELTKFEVRQPLWASAYGAAALNSPRDPAGSYPPASSVIPAAHSGVYSASRWRLAQSKPTVYWFTNALLYRRSVMMTFSMARWKARSVPGRDGQPIGRLGRGLGEARVQVHHLRAAVDGLDQFAGLGVGDGLSQVAACEDDVLELAVVAIPVLPCR